MTSHPSIITLDLAKKIAPFISTRVAIQVFKYELEALKVDKIIFDFSSVESISRSAAHELIITKFDLTNFYNKEVVFQNMSPLVSKLLATVTDSAINSKPKDRNVTSKSVDFSELKTISF